MKKLLKPLLFVIAIFCIGTAYYLKTYEINDDLEIVKSRLIQFINRPSVIIKDIDIKQELNIDNKKYVLFVIDEKLGNAELTKGINNKYKIDSTGYGNGSFRDEINRTNKGKYLILEGKNLDNKIAYVKVFLENKEYKIDIPQKEYYMVYCSVPTETERMFLDSNNIKFYNKNDIDITVEVFKN